MYIIYTIYTYSRGHLPQTLTVLLCLLQCQPSAICHLPHTKRKNYKKGKPIWELGAKTNETMNLRIYPSPSPTP